jgi:hypothetical protein
MGPACGTVQSPPAPLVIYLFHTALYIIMFHPPRAQRPTPNAFGFGAAGECAVNRGGQCARTKASMVREGPSTMGTAPASSAW